MHMRGVLTIAMGVAVGRCNQSEGTFPEASPTLAQWNLYNWLVVSIAVDQIDLNSRFTNNAGKA